MTTQQLLSIPQVVQIAHVYLSGLEAQIREAVLENLGARQKGQWSQDDDILFAPFNGYVQSAWLLDFPLRPVRLWFTDLLPAVVQLEGQVGHVHKGAPLFNIGLCFFMAGDYPRALQYIGAAGGEDEIRAPGGASKLLTGAGLSEQVLLQPLYAWLRSNFGADYSGATGCDLDSGEFQGLIAFLAARLGDATLLLAAR
jgi:hypothetical protein